MADIIGLAIDGIVHTGSILYGIFAPYLVPPLDNFLWTTYTKVSSILSDEAPEYIDFAPIISCFLVSIALSPIYLFFSITFLKVWKLLRSRNESQSLKATQECDQKETGVFVGKSNGGFFHIIKTIFTPWNWFRKPTGPIELRVSERGENRIKRVNLVKPTIHALKYAICQKFSKKEDSKQVLPLVKDILDASETIIEDDDDVMSIYRLALAKQQNRDDDGPLLTVSLEWPNC